MKFYFSGIRGRREADLLLEAGIDTVLMTPSHFNPGIADLFGTVALDSPAYGNWKAGREKMSLDQFIGVARSYPFAWVVSDVFGDAEAEASREYWLAVKDAGLDCPVMPVWSWGTDERILQEYLDEAPVVGIGGLVPYLRRRRKHEDPPPVPREQTLQHLADLAEQFPGRFHAFGACWAKSLGCLWELLASADTSHWLSPKRHGEWTGMVTYVSKWGYLQEGPQKALGYSDDNENGRLAACVETCDIVIALLISFGREYEFPDEFWAPAVPPIIPNGDAFVISVTDALSSFYKMDDWRSRTMMALSVIIVCFENVYEVAFEDAFAAHLERLQADFEQ